VGQGAVDSSRFTRYVDVLLISFNLCNNFYNLLYYMASECRNTMQFSFVFFGMSRYRVRYAPYVCMYVCMSSAVVQYNIILSLRCSYMYFVE
jgi:hypothetical protein